MSGLDNDLSNDNSIDLCNDEGETEKRDFLPCGNPIVAVVLVGRI